MQYCYNKNIIDHRERRIYWRSHDDLVNQFGDDLLKQLKLRGAIEEWTHQNGLLVTTLTPWSASILGLRLAEYWVRNILRVQEFRGINRRLKWVRIQQWDTESYWTYVGRPEKSIRVPSNTCELPLIGDPEDKTSQSGKQEYLEDLMTFRFTTVSYTHLTLP